MPKFLLIFMLVATAISASDSPSRTQLPTSVEPGGLILGQTVPGSTVYFGARRLLLTADGRFVAGVGPDPKGQAIFEFKYPDGSAEKRVLTLLPREYAVERVNGLPQQTVNPDPATEARIAAEQARVAKARERNDDRSDVFGGFYWPARGRISGVYGSQRVLNGVPKNPHYGVDVAAPTGTPIAAPQAGVISFAETGLVLTGGTVLIDHGHGVSSAFIHMSRLDVAVGDRVAQGEIIGAVGATGRASGPHLHWGMNWFDVRLDPQKIAVTGP
ncbi:MAG: M23 family metallopeptidase [Ahniella sp.]|nr:M23 family metallopeptidase [Ahniella sp.]